MGWTYQPPQERSNMTLKEKVAEITPTAVHDKYLGGVDGCPNDFHSLCSDDVLGNCPRDKNGNVLTCTACWNQEYKEPTNEK